MWSYAWVQVFSAAAGFGGSGWGTDVLQGQVAGLKALLNGNLYSYWYFRMESEAVSEECPSDIAVGISVEGS